MAEKPRRGQKKTTRRTKSTKVPNGGKKVESEGFEGLQLMADIASERGTRELLESILAKSIETFGCNSGSILIYKQESQELELVAAVGPMKKVLKGVRQPLGEGIAGAVAQRQEGMVVEDINKAGLVRKNTARYETNSFACVPIIFRGELLGVLNLCDKKNGAPFDADDMQKMLSLTGFSAGTIHHSIQQEKLRGFNIELHRRLDNVILKLQQANQMLVRLKNFNESILTSIGLGLVAFDENLTVTFHNEQVEKILGLETDAAWNDGFAKLNITCDGLKWEDVLKAVSSEGRSIRCPNAEMAVEKLAEHGDKAAAHHAVLNIMASPLRDAHERIVGGVVVIEDVTERVRMEKQLSATERHAVIGKLAARVAHELNNPLDGILRFINLSIALKGEDDPTREYLSECKRGLERMVGIVSSLLEFSRTTFPTHHDTKINEVIREAVRTLRHRADQQGIEVKLDLQDGLPEVKCGELVQVFLNLTKNAYDAMKQGGKFAVTTRLTKMNEIKIVVQDAGHGIPREIVGRVFDPFFTTKGPSEGTGLGLAICYDIIDKHGGKISVDSEVGKGTAFTIILPVT